MVDVRAAANRPVVERVMRDVLPTPWLPTAGGRTGDQLFVRSRSLGSDSQMTTFASRYSAAPRSARSAGAPGTCKLEPLLAESDARAGRGLREGNDADDPTEELRSSATEDAALPSSTVGNGIPAVVVVEVPLVTLAERCAREGKNACCVVEKDKVRERRGAPGRRGGEEIGSGSSVPSGSAAAGETNVLAGPTDLVDRCTRLELAGDGVGETSKAKSRAFDAGAAIRLIECEVRCCGRADRLGGGGWG